MLLRLPKAFTKRWPNMRGNLDDWESKHRVRCRNARESSDYLRQSVERNQEYPERRPSHTLRPETTGLNGPLK